MITQSISFSELLIGNDDIQLFALCLVYGNFISIEHDPITLKTGITGIHVLLLHSDIYINIK